MKTYLADGVYAEFVGYAIVLTTEDGYRTTNTIVLDGEVLAAFESFVQRVKDEKRKSFTAKTQEVDRG